MRDHLAPFEVLFDSCQHWRVLPNEIGHECGPFDFALAVLFEMVVVVMRGNLEKERLLQVIVTQGVVHVEDTKSSHR